MLLQATVSKEQKKEANQRSIIPFLALIIIGIALYTIFVKLPSVNSALSTAHSEKQRQAVVDHFNSDKEINTQQALWVSDTLIVVKVLYSQGNRDVYAQHVCQTLVDYQLYGQGISVEVQAHKGRHNLLGYARCR